jgi:NADH pyrophosphatase NudC (nudix superfamily)
MKFCPECASRIFEREIDGKARLACSQCKFVVWGNPTPVVAVPVQLGQDYVLARNKAWPQGLFSMITGFVEGGETPEQTLAREVQEELALEVVASDFVGHFSVPGINQLLIAFVATCRGTPRCGAELAELRRLSATDLKDFDFGPLALTRKIADEALARAPMASR